MTVNQFDDASLANGVRKAEELAKLAPEDAEYMPPLEPQTYIPVNAYAEETAKVSPELRASIARECIVSSEPKGLTSAGFIENNEGFSMLGNSKGLLGYHKNTSISYSATARTNDGTGSGWAGGGHTYASKLDSSEISRRAVEKAIASAHPQSVDPGKYTVILEPEAVANLMGSFLFRLDARSADEGRSFFADKDGRNKIGQQIFPEFVHIATDPTNPEGPGFPWGEDGLPARKITWIDRGVVKNLRYSRYWAQKQGKEALPFPSNAVMQGGKGSVDDLIASTDQGILVTRFWYIRDVDPMSMLLTGLTRDGVFWIEKGKIAHSIKNFRFNESPVAMLKNIEMMSKPVRMQNGGTANLLPALKVREFTFTSLSDAV
jgi:predicted Zn-dependent protease